VTSNDATPVSLGVSTRSSTPPPVIHATFSLRRIRTPPSFSPRIHSTSRACFASSSAFHSASLTIASTLTTSAFPILFTISLNLPQHNRGTRDRPPNSPLPGPLIRLSPRPLVTSSPCPLSSRFFSRVIVALPTQVPRRLMHCLRNVAEVRCNVVFEALAADMLQQLLQLRNLRHARAAECLQRIFREPSRARISAHDPAPVVRRITRIAHHARLYTSNASPERIQLAHRTRDDLLVVHLHVFEEVLRQVRAVEAHALVRVGSVVVIPVQQR